MIDQFIGVVRVSTDTQAKDGHSVGTQTKALREYGARLKARHVVIIPDDISGTTPIRERPGGARLYRHIDARPANCAVCFYDVSRVARDIDVFEVVQLMRDLRQAGIEFHVLNRGRIDLNDPFAKVLIFMEGAASANENVVRTRKATENRRAKAESGKIVGNGKAPYCHDVVGYRKDVDYKVNKERARWIQQAAKKIIKNTSTEGAARWLQEQGAPLATPTARGWYQSTLIRILHNKALIGRFRHGAITVQRDDLRILDDETFEALQQALANNRSTLNSHGHREWLLSGRVRCTCGRSMTSRPGSNGTAYYRCTSYDRRRLVEPCGERYARANGQQGIEAAVWSKVLEFCSDDARIRLGVQEHNAIQNVSIEPLRDELDEAERDLQRERLKLNRLSASLGDASAAAAGVIQRQVTASAERIAALENRSDMLKRRLAQPVAMLDEVKMLTQIRKIRAGLTTADFAKRRATLGIFGVHCQLESDKGCRRAKVTFDILESVNFFVEVKP